MTWKFARYVCILRFTKSFPTFRRKNISPYYGFSLFVCFYFFLLFVCVAVLRLCIVHGLYNICNNVKKSLQTSICICHLIFLIKIIYTHSFVPIHLYPFISTHSFDLILVPPFFIVNLLLTRSHVPFLTSSHPSSPGLIPVILVLS